MCYYNGTDSFEDNFPEIRLVEKRTNSVDLIKLVENSFKDRDNFNGNISISNIGTTMVLIERRTGKQLPLLSNTYDLIKKNLEHIFGAF